MNINNILNELGKIATEKIINELIQQGHRATGKLIDSVQYKVYKDLFEDGLEVSLLRYGIYVDKGVRNFKITGAYITAIIKWLRVKEFGGDEKERRSIAWAIGKAHEKEGIPTLNSYRHPITRNGRRLNFIGIATRDIGKTARKMIGDAAEKEVLIKIDNIIRKTSKTA